MDHRPTTIDQKKRIFVRFFLSYGTIIGNFLAYLKKKYYLCSQIG